MFLPIKKYSVWGDAFFITLMLSIFTSNSLLGMAGVDRYQKGQESVLRSKLYNKFREWVAYHDYIGSRWIPTYGKNFAVYQFEYTNIPIFIKAYPSKMEVYKNATGDGAPVMTIMTNDAICGKNSSEFYEELRSHFTELPVLPAPVLPAPVVPAPVLSAPVASETINKERALANEMFLKNVCLMLAEYCTALGGFLFTEMSECYKTEDDNSKKALVSEILANICLIVNGIAYGLNQLVNRRQTALDYGTGFSMAARVAVIITLIKKLYTPNTSEKKKSENDEKHNDSNNTENDKNNKAIKILGKIAAHAGGILPVVRFIMNIANFQKSEFSKTTYTLTLFMLLSHAVEIAAKTNNSDSKILNMVAPFALGSIPVDTAIVDKFSIKAH